MKACSHDGREGSIGRVLQDCVDALKREVPTLTILDKTGRLEQSLEPNVRRVNVEVAEVTEDRERARSLSSQRSIVRRETRSDVDGLTADSRDAVHDREERATRFDKHGEQFTQRVVNPAVKEAARLETSLRLYLQQFAATPASRETVKPTAPPRPKKPDYPEGSVGWIEEQLANDEEETYDEAGDEVGSGDSTPLQAGGGGSGDTSLPEGGFSNVLPSGGTD